MEVCENSVLLEFLHRPFMTEQSPATLSDIEILDILRSMKNDVLSTEAQEVIRQGG
jgi:hypothetical protein